MDKIRAEKPDLAILDVMMNAWHDGFEMTRQLKKEFKNMPVLILTAIESRTGLNFKSTAGDPLWLPVDAFLSKPIEPQTLLAKVKILLSNNTVN